jgi:hypothetical protein
MDRYMVMEGRKEGGKDGRGRKGKGGRKGVVLAQKEENKNRAKQDEGGGGG